MVAALVFALAAQPAAALDAATLGVVINDADPYSVAIGRFDVERRGIPAQQRVHVSFPATRHMTAEPFAASMNGSSAHCLARCRRWRWPGHSRIASLHECHLRLRVRLFPAFLR